jgi:hypothetical protein
VFINPTIDIITILLVQAFAVILRDNERDVSVLGAILTLLFSYMKYQGISYTEIGTITNENTHATVQAQVELLLRHCLHWLLLVLM